MINAPSEFGINDGGSREVVESAERELSAQFPQDYKEFLATTDGGEGWVGEHYLVLWRATELAPFNADYEFSEYAPALIGFGGNGGGEAFAFDTRFAPYKIVIVPLIGMSNDDAIVVASDFNSFIERLKVEDSLF